MCCCVSHLVVRRSHCDWHSGAVPLTTANLQAHHLASTHTTSSMNDRKRPPVVPKLHAVEDGSLARAQKFDEAAATFQAIRHLCLTVVCFSSRPSTWVGESSMSLEAACILDNALRSLSVWVGVSLPSCMLSFQVAADQFVRKLGSNCAR